MGWRINYNNIIGKKLDLQSNYFYNRFNPNTESHIQRQYLLPDTSYYNSNSYADNLNNTHRANLNLLYQLDSLNSIRVIPSFSYQQTRNRSNTDYQTMSKQQSMINDGYSNSISNSEGYNFRNEIAWRRKFLRKGRTFSLTLQTTLNETDGDGSLSSINSFYQPNGSLSRKDTLNQQSTTTGSLRGYTARAVYTEPLGKRTLMEFSIGKSNTRNLSEKLTYDYNKNNGKYDVQNAFLSNDFENSYGFTNAGFRIRNQQKKYNFSLGVNWQQSDLDGKIISGTKDSLISKRFQNLLPNARFQYNFTRFKNLSLTYNTNTNQPSMTQLQPVPDVSNPLNIRDGNPDLKQEYNHNLQANLALVSPFSSKNLFFFLRAQAAQNKIVNYDSLNQLTGVRKTKPVNVNGVYNLSANFSYSRPVRFLKGNIELSSNVGYNRGKQLINTLSSPMEENAIGVFSVGPELRLDMTPTDKFNLVLGTS
jgi:hypothetical protein